MELYNFDDHIIINICNHLPYISRMCMKFTCKRFNDVIKGPVLDITPIVKSKLRAHLEDNEVDYFLKLISKYGIISGSFVLSCIYDTDWYNDIDIYEDISIVMNEWEQKTKLFDLIEDENLRNIKRRNYHKKFFMDEMVDNHPWYPGHLSYKPGQYTRISKFLLRYQIVGGDPDTVFGSVNYDLPPYYEESHYARDFKLGGTKFQHIILESDPSLYISNKCSVPPLK